MKFDIEKVNGRTAGMFFPSWVDLSGVAANGDTQTLEFILREYSLICGEKTKKRLRDLIDGNTSENIVGDVTSCAVDYSDTPIRGKHYVYLWFDSDGELFYVGKGRGERAHDMKGRTQEFRERATDGHYRYVSYNMDEIYALDLERVLIWESFLLGKRLLNADGGNGKDAIQYCKHDRDALLWYWDQEGTIGCFSRLVGDTVIYDARHVDVNEAIDSRWLWNEDYTFRLKTNDPIVLDNAQKTAKKKKGRNKNGSIEGARG